MLVIGAGMAGLAASIHLAKSGFEVICLEPGESASQPVGESLDWSAPALLEALGLPMEHLIAGQIATYKRHVTLKLPDGSSRHYIPSGWLGRPPFNIELRTLHVDRVRLDKELRKIAVCHGVRIITAKAVSVETEGSKVIAINTASGDSFAASWFVDASGSGASLLPRAFRLPVEEYGPKKVAIWSYFQISESIEGTTLYASHAASRYIEWIWEIPIRPGIVSVGYVAPGDAIKTMRQDGITVEQIYRARLSRLPHLEALLESSPGVSPHVTSFRCHVHHEVSGPNWVAAGESASLVDPMTSNGVTAALRHAAEGAALIRKFHGRGQIPYRARAMYNRRVRDLGRFFNSGIERIFYDWPVRTHIGALTAGDVYTVPAWSFNSLYARIRPSGVLSTLLFCSILRLLVTAVGIYYVFCKRRCPVPETNA